VAGFSARIARQPRARATHIDPLTDVWPRVLEMLKIPGMMSGTIFEGLQDEVCPEVFPERVRRTLERRTKDARAARRG
jgi:hypothetical protein